MKCQHCNEENATIHLTEIEGGVKKEIHLCETCYKEKNLLSSKPPSIDNLIKNFIDDLEDNLKDDEKIICPVCGISYVDFQKTGVFGCPEDYSVFREEISTLLDKIHGATVHTGKIPDSVLVDRTNADRLIMLRKELDDAIRHEMYERAAELRDEIHQLEEKERSCS